MAIAGSTDEAPAMPTNSPPQSHRHALADEAYELERAAEQLQRQAAGATEVPTHGATLAHIERALDQLSVGMLQMANAVVGWSAEQGLSVEEDDLPPGAQALCFHLRATADALRVTRDACTSSRAWSRRLLDAAADLDAETRECAPVP
jgi:hypothetical protein